MIRGVLFDDHTVALDDKTRAYGGSWLPSEGELIWAFGQGVLKAFYEQIAPLQYPTVLDIGANTGSFCLLAALHSGMTCYAFEPILASYSILRRNIQLNGLDERVIPFRVALSDYIGFGQMTVPDDNKLSGLSYLDERAPDHPCHPETVNVSTINAMCSTRRVDAIKLDVEGIEARVLRGGDLVIERDHPIIMLEATNTNQTIPILREWGYTIHDLKSDLLALYERN